MTDTPPSVGQGPLVPPVVPQPTRPSGPSHRVLIAAILTTILAVGVLVLFGPGSGGDEVAVGRSGDRNGPSTYQVRQGDTITAVAELHGLPVDTLLAAHDLTLADSLEPGRPIEIPPLSSRGGAWPEPLTEDPLRAQQNGFFGRWAEEYEVHEALLQSLGWAISKWDNASTNDDGDLGIGRLDPDLVAWLNTEVIAGDVYIDPRSAEGNIHLMAAYLGHLLEITQGDHATSVATYFQGQTEPTSAPWSLTTRKFVTRVLELVPNFEAPPPPSATTTTTSTTVADEN